MIAWLLDHAAVISLLFFFCFFVMMCVLAYRPSQKAKLQSYANIPLSENEHG